MNSELLATHFIKRHLKHLSEKKDDCDKYHIVLPIYRLDKIPVSVSLTASNFHVRIQVSSGHDFYQFESETEEPEALEFYENHMCLEGIECSGKYKPETIKLNTENIKNLFDKWFGEISELRFSTLLNTMVSEERLELEDIFQTMENVNEDMECCVCQEATTGMTHCGHRICYPCQYQVKTVRDEEYGNMTKPCPICRDCMGF